MHRLALRDAFNFDASIHHSGLPNSGGEPSPRPFDLLPSHGTAHEGHGPPRPEQDAPSLAVGVSDDKPPGTQAFEDFGELVCALAFPRLIGEAVEDALAIGVGLQSTETP